MSAVANIAIQDGQVSPVTHTFYPIQTVAPVMYREALSGVALIGNGTVVANIKHVNSLNKVSVTLKLPALETVTAANSEGYTAAPKEAYSNTVKVEFILPDRGTSAQRKDLRVLLMDLFTDAQFIDMIDELRMPY